MSEEWSARNTALVLHVSETLAALDTPWVVAGDFNAEPSTFAAVPWVSALGEVMVLPSEALGTCRTKHGSVTLGGRGVSEAAEAQVLAIDRG